MYAFADDDRYNTFYVLYPIGISSECIMVWKALKPAAEWNPLYWWFLVVVLVIYVPGMLVLVGNARAVANFLQAHTFSTRT
jgi:very-long-chain (3R)-3-hydroxyacyl-CoA dehydratase